MAPRALGRLLVDQYSSYVRSLDGGRVASRVRVGWECRRCMAMKKMLPHNQNAKEALWMPRFKLPMLAKAEDFAEAPLVTARGLRSAVTRPRNVKMLMSDFIEGKARLLIMLSMFSSSLNIRTLR